MKIKCKIQIKILSFPCLRPSTYILSDSIMKLCEAGLSTFIIELKRRKMWKVASCQMSHDGTLSFQLLGSTREASLMILSHPLILISSKNCSQFYLQTTSRVWLYSTYWSSIMSFLGFHVASLTTSIISRIGLLTPQSTQVLQWKHPDGFHHSQSKSWSLINGLKCLMCLDSFLLLKPWVKLHSSFYPFYSTLPALLLCLSLVRSDICRCLGALALASPLVWNAFPHTHMAHMCTSFRSSLVAQTVKNQPAIQETRVQSPGQEDPLQEGMAPHSSILAWRATFT